MLKKSRFYYLKIFLPIAALLILAVCIFNYTSILKWETADKYSSFLPNQFLSENIFVLPKEYESVKRISLIIDNSNCFINDGYANKIFFQINGESCYMYYIYGEYYTTTTYPDIYNDETNEKIATLWEKPQGYFMLDDFIYYVYGKEKLITFISSGFLTGHNLFLTLNNKNTRFARLNLSTKENEEISKESYLQTREELYARGILNFTR